MADSKGEYEDRLMVRGDPRRVFDFIADIRNLPHYVPTTKSAQPQGEDRVQVQGEANGQAYDADGYLRADAEAMRLEWGADEGYYAGWMQIRPDGDGAEVTVHLSLRDTPGDDGDWPAPEQVREGLRKGLESIKSQVEGQGGKQEPSAAT